jgi:ABC-type glycerol-3-phosphate transport system substrate-binding protein
MPEQDKQDGPKRRLDRADFLRTAGAVTAGVAAASALGAPTALADRMGRPLRKTTIRFIGLFFLDAEVAAAHQFVNAFNKQSNTVQVEYVQGSWGTISNQMTVAFSSGDVPDVFHYYDAGLVPWGQNGLLSDLRSLVPASIWNDVNAGTLSALTSPKGDRIGLPFETETPVIYYNVDIFKKAGIPPATLAQPWTWDKLKAVGKQLSNPAQGQFGITANWSASEILFKNGLAWQAGATPIHYSGGNYSINVSDAGDQATLAFVQSLFQQQISDIKTLSVDPLATFQKGKTAMAIRGAWARSSLPTPGGKNVNWAVMPFTKGKVVNLGSGAAQTLSIPTSSKNKDAAAEFLAFWGKPANIAAICKASDQIPPSKQAVTLLKSQTKNAPDWLIALAEAADLHGQPYCPGWLDMITKVWNPAMDSLLQGKSSLADFTSTVNSKGTDFVQTAAGNN